MGIDRRTASLLALAGLCGACGRTELWPALAPITTSDGGLDAAARDADGGDARSSEHADAHPTHDPCSASGNPCGAGQRCVPSLFRQLPGVPGGPDVVLTLGDVNRDGLVDLVTVSPSAGGVSVWLNDSVTFHTDGQRYLTEDQPIAAAIGDFTGDGIADIAVATFSAGEVTTLVGAGDGTFQKGFFTSVGALPRAMAALDLNSDGRLDLAVANQDPGRTDDVTIMSAIGNGVFVPGGRYGSRASQSAIAVGDFNNDGLPDIAAASAADSSVTVIYNEDVTSPVVYPLPTGARALAVADYDGDGVADLAVAGDEAIAILLGRGNLPIKMGPVLTTDATPKGVASAVVAGDFDDDGNPDLAFADGKQLYVFRGTAAGDFQPARALLTPGDLTQPTQLAAGDLDGDGVTDLLVGSLTGEIVRFLSTANGVLVQAPSVPITGASNSSVTGDFDGDGNVDIAVGQYHGQAGVLELLGDGRGAFPRSHLYPFGDTPEALAADLDGDGRSDLIVFNARQTTADVRISRSDGSPGDLRQYPIGGDEGSATTLDANEDGHLDLAVTGLVPASGLALLLGNGDGTLRPPIEVPGAGGSDIAAVDLDGDGHVDLAIAQPSGIQVFFGDGRAHFLAAPLVSIKGGPLGALIGDATGDGHPDIVAFNMNPNGLETVLLGRDRTLVALDPTPIAEHFELFAAGGDFNGDGRLDIAFDSQSSNLMGLALGKGDGTFRVRRQYPEPGECGTINVTDLNNDGRPDVVAVTTDTNLGSPKLGIWLGAAPFECR